MTKDKILFILSFALLGLVAAFLFKSNTPAPVVNEKASPEAVQVVKEVAEVDFLPVEPGKIAVPFQLKSRSGVIQFITPGTLVDIRFTSKSDTALESVSLILLQDIRVLGIGKDSDGKRFNEKGNFYKPNTPVEILLEMTPEQSEVLSYAELSGEISFDIDKEGRPYGRDELVEKLLKSKSDENFTSILITHMLQSLFPGADIKIIATGKGYIVSGTVADVQTAGKVVKILDMMAPGGNKGVVNLLEHSEAVEVLAASKELKVGEHLSPADYDWIKINLEQANPKLIIKNGQAEKWLNGAVVGKAMHAGDKINRCDIIWPQAEDEHHVSDRIAITPGKRVIPVELSPKAPIAQFVSPGVSIDIKFTSKADIGFSPDKSYAIKKYSHHCHCKACRWKGSQRQGHL